MSSRPRRLFSPDDPSPFEAQPGDLDYRTVDDDLAAEEEDYDDERRFLLDREEAEERAAQLRVLHDDEVGEWLT